MSPVPEYGCSSGRQCTGKALVLTCDGCKRDFHGHLLTVVGDGAGLLCADCQRLGWESVRCCPGQGTMAHVRGCRNHPESAQV